MKLEFSGLRRIQVTIVSSGGRADLGSGVDSHGLKSQLAVRRRVIDSTHEPYFL